MWGVFLILRSQQPSTSLRTNKVDTEMASQLNGVAVRPISPKDLVISPEKDSRFRTEQVIKIYKRV